MPPEARCESGLRRLRPRARQTGNSCVSSRPSSESPGHLFGLPPDPRIGERRLPFRGSTSRRSWIACTKARSMDYQELREDLDRVLEDLIERNQRAPIIVEGEYDRRSLRALGIRGDIRVLNRGNSILRLCESIAEDHRHAIILTDWDVRGGRIARMLRDGLSANGVKYDDEIRARLALLCRRDIKDVESLHGFVERVSEKAAVRDQQRPSHRYYSERARARDVRRRSRN